MVTWGLGSAVLGPGLCPSLCKSMTTATRKMDKDDITELLFEYTGVYVSEYSILAPVLWTARLLLGSLTLVQRVSSDNKDILEDFCPTLCSADMVRSIAVAGCGSSLMGNNLIAVSPSLICPVSFLTQKKTKQPMINCLISSSGVCDGMGSV